MRDEIRLLPHFLRHYRDLGVEKFFFIDNGSADGSIEYVERQPDCYLFQSLDGFRSTSVGMNWVNEIARKYCMGRWIVFVDCDELLVYPNCEEVTLSEFCARQGNADTVFGAMIDVYPGGSFLTCQLSPTDDFRDVMGYFDTEYVFRWWPMRPWDKAAAGVSVQVLGGPRIRMLSSLSRERRRGAFYYTVCNQVDRFIDKVPRSWISAIASIWPKEMPAQQKSPINFVSEGFHFMNPHSNNNCALANETVALLHLKLCDDLKRRMDKPTMLDEYYRRGLSYEQLRKAISRWSASTLRYEGSRQYRSSADLMEVGLIGENVARLWTETRREISTPLTAE